MSKRPNPSEWLARFVVADAPRGEHSLALSRALVEALIFASPQPLAPRQLAQVLREVPTDAWKAAVEELRSDYERDGRGLQLVDIAGGYQITTCPEYNDSLRALLDPNTASQREHLQRSRNNRRQGQSESE